MGKILRGIGKAGIIITNPFCVLGTCMISEMAEAIDAIIVVLAWIVGTGVIVYLKYPYKTIIGFIAAIIFSALGTMFLSAILWGVLRLLRYVIAAISSPFCFLYLGFEKLYQKGMEKYYGGQHKGAAYQNEQMEKQMEEQLKKQMEEQLKKQMEEQMKKQMEEQMKKQMEEQMKKQMEEQLKKQMEEQLKKRMEEQSRRSSRDADSTTYSDRKNGKAGADSNDKGLTYRDAMNLYMLTDTFTRAELKKQRNRLLKSFHPDEGDVQTMKYAQRINNAYEVLQQYAKG